ncbi:ketopantoate reductase PanE/ApbA C terminal-domain-containing protein [Hyaloraphidium curvatum]|nr:ketopantoate reductase PanE/ApbA C terminal-domain-containing protein [Hyaloraphidium curvatum]
MMSGSAAFASSDSAPKRVLLVGAGAVGVFFASRLGPSVRVSAVARSDLGALRERGGEYLVRSKSLGDYSFRPEHVFASVEEAGPGWDYVLLATKSLPSHDAAELVAPAVEPGRTAVLFMQNGIGNERTTALRFGAGVSIGTAVVYVAADREAPGIIRHVHQGALVIGNYTGEGDLEAGQFEVRPDTGERLAWIAERWKENGVKADFVPDVLPFVWNKLAGNNAFNPTTALGNCTCGSLGRRENPSGRRLVLSIFSEVYAVATAALGVNRFPPKGIPTGEPAVDQFLSAAGEFRSSMAQDFIAGRECEVEAIVGEVVRRAAKVGVDVPRVDSMYALTRLAEAAILAERGDAGMVTLSR